MIGGIPGILWEQLYDVLVFSCFVLLYVYRQHLLPLLVGGWGLTNPPERVTGEEDGLCASTGGNLGAG